MKVLEAIVIVKASAVSVSASLPIAGVVRQFPPTAFDSGTVPVGLLAALAAVADPRARRGVRHRFHSVLAVAVCAVLAGAKSFIAVAEWAADLSPAVRGALGMGRRPPCESTIRRVLEAVDGQALDEVLCRWLTSRMTPTDGAAPIIAIDGKTARGARTGDERAVHLLAAFDTTTGVALGQSVVDGKTNEINVFAPLLDRIDITGAIITADALHTQAKHVTYLASRGAHYILTVKGNQPTLLAQLRALPWKDIPVADRTTGKGHGRIESRTVKLTAVEVGIGFPHAHLAIQITRKTRPRRGGKRHLETVYAITDLTYHQTSAAALADAIRAHWGIENRLHWVRDVTFAEDLSQIRTGHGPAVMASLRNLAISLHRLAGANNIAAAARHISRHPSRVLPLIT